MATNGQEKLAPDYAEIRGEEWREKSFVGSRLQPRPVASKDATLRRSQRAPKGKGSQRARESAQSPHESRQVEFPHSLQHRKECGTRWLSSGLCDKTSVDDLLNSNLCATHLSNMYSKMIAILLFVLGSLSGSQALGRSNTRVLSYSVSKRNEDSLLKYLRPALRSSGYVGQIYYSGQCEGTEVEFVFFPQVQVLPPSGNPGLSAIRDMLRGNDNVLVSEEPRKAILIRIGQPDTTILKTRIHVFKLAPLGQYNPSAAIGSVENTGEFKGEMGKLGIHVPLTLSGQILTKPSPGLPHLPAEMKGVTVEQVLNSIAVTFKGIVIYGTCAQPDGKGLLEIDFTGLEE